MLNFTSPQLLETLTRSCAGPFSRPALVILVLYYSLHSSLRFAQLKQAMKTTTTTSEHNTISRLHDGDRWMPLWRDRGLIYLGSKIGYQRRLRFLTAFVSVTTNHRRLNVSGMEPPKRTLLYTSYGFALLCERIYIYIYIYSFVTAHVLVLL